MKWSKDDKELQNQVKQKLGELGFDFPQTKEHIKLWDEAFKGYPHEGDPTKIDPYKILGLCYDCKGTGDDHQEFNHTAYPVCRTCSGSGNKHK